EFIGRGHHLVPDDFTVIAFHGDHSAVGKVRDHQVLPQRHTARARRVALVFDAWIRDPHERTFVRIAGIDLVDRAPTVRRVHETVIDKRIYLVFRTVLTDVL